MQSFNPGHVVHHPEGVAVDVELAALQARPCRDAGAGEPLLEPVVAPLAIGRVNGILAAVAGIEPLQQIADHCCLVLLHEVPQRHVNRHAAGLYLGNRLGAVIRPMQHALDVRRRQSLAAAQLLAQ